MYSRIRVFTYLRIYVFTYLRIYIFTYLHIYIFTYLRWDFNEEKLKSQGNSFFPNNSNFAHMKKVHRLHRLTQIIAIFTGLSPLFLFHPGKNSIRFFYKKRLNLPALSSTIYKKLLFLSSVLDIFKIILSTALDKGGVLC